MEPKKGSSPLICEFYNIVHDIKFQLSRFFFLIPSFGISYDLFYNVIYFRTDPTTAITTIAIPTNMTYLAIVLDRIFDNTINDFPYS